MDTDRVLPHQTVLVQGGRIAALGPVSTITVPKRAARIDGQGRYLTPGLSACHGHIANSVPYAPPNDPRYLQLHLLLLLSEGVTFLRNVDYLDYPFDAKLGSPFHMSGRYLLGLREQAARGQLWSPRLVVAGQWAPKQYTGYQRRLFTPSPPWPEPRMDSVAAYVAAYKAAGYNFIKLHEESPEMADSVLAAARRVGMQVGGHVVGPLERAIAGGQTVADHIGELGAWPDPGESPDAAYRAKLATQVSARWHAGMWTCIGGDIFSWDSLIVPLLTDSGAGVLTGSDGGSGLGSFPKLVKKGHLTSYQVLSMATKNFGQYLRTIDPHGDDIGTIAVGQRADLLLLTGNPLENITYAANDAPEQIGALVDTETNPALVMIGGRWLTRAELNRRVTAVLQYNELLHESDQQRSMLQADSTIAASTRRTLAQLDSVHQEQGFVLAARFALAKTSPAGGADSLRGPQLLTELFARQFGEVRAVLPAPVRDRFDTELQAWLAARSAAGYRVTIPSLNP